MKKALLLSLILIATSLLSVSCSNFIDNNKIALKCKTKLRMGEGKDATNNALDETYLIKFKENKIFKYDNTLIQEMLNVSIAPKIISFEEKPNPLNDPDMHIIISTSIDRETLSLKIRSISRYLDNIIFGEGTGICEKIPYPSLVSTKNKV